MVISSRLLRGALRSPRLQEALSDPLRVGRGDGLSELVPREAVEPAHGEGDDEEDRILRDARHQREAEGGDDVRPL